MRRITVPSVMRVGAALPHLEKEKGNHTCMLVRLTKTVIAIQPS